MNLQTLERRLGGAADLVSEDSDQAKHRPDDGARPAHRQPSHQPATQPRIKVEGKFLSVDGKRFYIKAVTYGTFSPNEQGEPYPAFEQVKIDFAQMAAAGVNCVRLYTP